MCRDYISEDHSVFLKIIQFKSLLSSNKCAELDEIQSCEFRSNKFKDKQKLIFLFESIQSK